jgi:hypothetical protein
VIILSPEQQAIGDLSPRFFSYRKDLPEGMDIKFLGEDDSVGAIGQRQNDRRF